MANLVLTTLQRGMRSDGAADELGDDATPCRPHHVTQLASTCGAAPRIGERGRADLHRRRRRRASARRRPTRWRRRRRRRSAGRGGLRARRSTARTATGWIAATATARRRRRRAPGAACRGSMTMPEQRVDAASPPRHRPRATAPATSTMRSVLALSLAHRGRPHAGVAAITVGRQLGVVGEDAAAALEVRARQVDLDGDDLGGAPASSSAARAVLVDRCGPRCSPRRWRRSREQAGQVVGRASAATPGPCSPTALSIPCGVGCSRGAGLPAHSKAASDLTTTAPSADEVEERRQLGRRSPAVPDAVITGLRQLDRPDAAPRRRRSSARHRPSSTVAHRAWYSCSERTLERSPGLLGQALHRGERGARRGDAS